MTSNKPAENNAEELNVTAKREPLPELLTIAEVAATLRCSKATVFELLNSNRLAGIRVLGRRLVDRADLVVFIEQARTKRPPERVEPPLRVELGRKVRGVRRYAD